MKKVLLLVFSMLVYGSIIAQPNQPNIIFILVDDLGYGDLGEFFQDDKRGRRFDTPFLDQMTNEGMRINNHYTVPVCAPSRSCLLQGLNSGHTEIRDNMFDRPIPLDMNIAQLMKLAGYSTYMVGKHGVAGGFKNGVVSHPLNHGFDDYFGYLNHVAGHEHYPRNGTTEKEAFIYEGKERISTGMEKVYTTDIFTARAKRNIIRHTRNNPDDPFFMYVAYDVPHSKLQIPTMAYPEGKGVNGGIQWTGPNNERTPYVNTARGTIDSWHYPDVARRNWNENEKKHVTMIRRLGECVNDILVTLQDLEIDKNTLVIFTSDNGPHNTGGQDPDYFQSYGPLRGGKRDVTDGGVRVPVIAWWPGTIEANSSSNQTCSMSNWAATFADIANRPVPARVDGASLLPILNGSRRSVNNQPPYVEYTHDSPQRQQMQFIRMGDYVGIRTNIEGQSDPLEIYNIVDDPKQQNNLANDFPQLQQTMRRAKGNAPRPYDNALVPSVPVNTYGNGLRYKTVRGNFDYIPRVEDLDEATSGRVNNVDLSVRPRGRNFAIQYTGFIRVPRDGQYTFFMESRAPAHMMIHDIHVVGSDIAHTNDEVSRSLYLQAGYHPVKVYYQHNSQSRYTLNLRYSGPGISKRAIPNNAFFRGALEDEATEESFVNIQHKTSRAILSGRSNGNQISITGNSNRNEDFANWSTVEINNGYFYIIQKSSGRKLHSSGDFSRINTTAATATGDNVQWRWVNVPGENWFRLEHKTSGRWLHLGTNGNASSFRLVSNSSTGDNTRWRPRVTSGASSSRSLDLEEVVEVDTFDFTLFPNPSQGNVNIDISGVDANEAAQITVLDISGRVIRVETISQLDGPVSLNLGLLKKGLYAVKVTTSNNESESKLLTIQ